MERKMKQGHRRQSDLGPCGHGALSEQVISELKVSGVKIGERLPDRSHCQLLGPELYLKNIKQAR